MLGEVTTTGEFLALAQRYQWYYNVERPHFGAGMGGKTPMEKLRELGLDLPDEFAAFPVVLPDEVAVIWASKGARSIGPLHHRASGYGYHLRTLYSGTLSSTMGIARTKTIRG